MTVNNLFSSTILIWIGFVKYCPYLVITKGKYSCFLKYLLMIYEEFKRNAFYDEETRDAYRKV